MKTIKTMFSLMLLSMFMVAGVARSAASLVGEELAVIQALAAIMNRDTPRHFDFLYFEADFSGRSYIKLALSDPDRTQFCGLSREQAETLVAELSTLTAEPLKFDKSVAKPAGLSIGHKKSERYRYLTLSRVVFAPDGQHAWLAADLNGESGGIYQLDKIAGEWNKTARCAGWVRAE